MGENSFFPYDVNVKILSVNRILKVWMFEPIYEIYCFSFQNNSSVFYVVRFPVIMVTFNYKRFWFISSSPPLTDPTETTAHLPTPLNSSKKKAWEKTYLICFNLVLCFGDSLPSHFEFAFPSESRKLKLHFLLLVVSMQIYICEESIESAKWILMHHVIFIIILWSIHTLRRPSSIDG